MLLGSHVSIAGSLARPFGDAAEIGCDAIQIFVKPPRKLRGVKPFTKEQIETWEEARKASTVKAVVTHANYLINLGGEGHTAEYSREAFLDEMKRCHELQIGTLIFHPGQHLGVGEDKGLRNIAKSLQWCLRKGKDYGDVTLAIECMAGQGTMVGYDLQHLRTIVDLVGQPDRFGYCLDTCHLFASGHELRHPEGYAKTMEQVGAVLGFENVRAFHLNDSKQPLASRVDRHEAIGKGQLRDRAFQLLVQDPRFRKLPGLVETPHDSNLGWAKDVRRLRKLEAQKQPVKVGLDKFR